MQEYDDGKSVDPVLNPTTAGNDFRVLVLSTGKITTSIINKVISEVGIIQDSRKDVATSPISQEEAPNLIVFDCDYRCQSQTCIDRFRRIRWLGRCPLVIIRPLAVSAGDRRMRAFYFSMFNGCPRTQAQEQTVEKLRAHRLYGDNLEIRYLFSSSLNRNLEIYRRICENFYELRSFEEMSGELMISPSRLSDSFKATFDMKPSDLLRAVRFCYASWLLLLTDLPIKFIACEIGYDPYSFSRSFRQMRGVSPGTARRNLFRDSIKGCPEPESGPAKKSYINRSQTERIYFTSGSEDAMQEVKGEDE